jgi:glycosyltransferase involved in cell wall biosynthesis
VTFDMRILFLSRWYPYPPDNGSKIRIYHLIRALAERHQVHLVSHISEPASPGQLEAMRAYCRQVETVPYRPFRPGSLKALAGLFAWRPRSVQDTFSPEMLARAQRVARAQSFDAVIASQIDMAPYALDLPIGSKFLEELELTMLYEQFSCAPGVWRKLRAGLTWWKYRRYTAQVLRAFDACTVSTEREYALVRQVAAAVPCLHVVPNGVDVSASAGDYGAPEAGTLIYSGALSYSANFDAMDYFLREIFPLIRAERPDAKLAITGKAEAGLLARLPQVPGVTFTGYLEDVRPAVAGSWASVVPLREGAGSRVKILEAMSLGTPVVTTSKGAEGLDVQPGLDLLVADTPAGFAAETLRLLGAPELRLALSARARQTVRSKYNWALIGPAFNQFLEASLASRGVA